MTDNDQEDLAYAMNAEYDGTFTLTNEAGDVLTIKPSGGLIAVTAINTDLTYTSVRLTVEEAQHAGVALMLLGSIIDGQWPQ